MNSQRTISICAANVQRLHNDSKRIHLFTHWARRTHADIFLLSEVGIPTPRDCLRWAEECRQLSLDAIFQPACQAAIVWRPNSPFLRDSRPSDICRISSRVDATRSIDAKFIVSGKPYIIMAIYVPVLSNARVTYLRDLRLPLARALETEEAIVGGDWNVVPDAVLDSSKPGSNNVGEQELLRLSTSCNLEDSYRILNPRQKLFTNKGTNGTDRRLDQIYVSRSMIGGISHFSTWQSYQSTHSPILLRWIVPGAIPIGPSWFKLGRHLTDDLELWPYLQHLTTSCHEKASLQQPESNPLERWQLAKTFLLPRLDALSRKLAGFRKRSKLDEHGRHEGLSTRARLPAELSGLSSVHIRLRQVREQDILPSVKAADGRHLTHVEDMLEESRRFFGELYEREAVNTAKQNVLLTSIRPKLSVEQFTELEAEWKEGEILTALKKCNIRSSPGPDGLPFGFYKATWSVTGPILKAILNFLLLNPEARPTHMTHIVLLHKKGDKDQLGNKRPISLINTDERIMDRAINARLAPILPSIIHPNQTGFIPGRWIGTNIETVQNAIDDGDLYPGALAVIDFEKAYDRVGHSYLLAVLKKFGFGPRFIRLVMAMTTGSHARICLNGWLSSSIPLSRGLRQGSPLAPSLFTLCIEPLAARLRSTLTGIRHTGLAPFQQDIQPLISLLFADDLVVGLRDERDLEKAEIAFELYQSSSGGRISPTKSFLHGMGAALRQRWPGWTISCTPFRYLGVQVGRGVRSKEIWASLVTQVKARMRAIPMFDLPIAARCSIINIYCFSMVLYMDQFLPSPFSVWKELIKAAVETIWAGKQHLVSKWLLFMPKEYGGFGLLRLDYQFDCGRAKWVAALLSGDWRAQRYNGALRRKLCQHIRGQIQYEERTAYNDFSKTTYHPETLERQYIEHTWVANFAQPSLEREEVHNQFDKARQSCLLILPERWKHYVTAWEDLVSLYPQYQRQHNWRRAFLAENQRVFDATAPLQLFHIQGDPRTSAAQVSLARKELVKRQYSPEIPLFDHRLYRTKETWKAWWTLLSKVRSRLPEEENSLHLYALGRLYSPAKWIQPGRPPDARWPHNTSRACILCMQDVEESNDHVLFHCRIGRALWRYLQPPSRHPLNAVMLLQPDQPYPIDLAFAAGYIHILFKLLRSRRLSPNPPAFVDHVRLHAQARKVYIKACSLEETGDD